MLLPSCSGRDGWRPGIRPVNRSRPATPDISGCSGRRMPNGWVAGECAAPWDADVHLETGIILRNSQRPLGYKSLPGELLTIRWTDERPTPNRAAMSRRGIPASNSSLIRSTVDGGQGGVWAASVAAAGPVAGFLGDRGDCQVVLQLRAGPDYVGRVEVGEAATVQLKVDVPAVQSCQDDCQVGVAAGQPGQSSDDQKITGPSRVEAFAELGPVPAADGREPVNEE